MINENPTVTALRIEVEQTVLTAVLEWELAPRTCATFLSSLPMDSKLVHCRWCGEGVWIPLGDTVYDVPWENASAHPAPGQVLLYPGGPSETELLLPYGATHFYSKAGPLVGNHFMTIVEGLDQLPAIGHDVLWTGAKDIIVTAVDGAVAA
jgi:hypothetical protein